jgi:tetratricopeptide (TPR) repeat protein
LALVFCGGPNSVPVSANFAGTELHGSSVWSTDRDQADTTIVPASCIQMNRLEQLLGFLEADPDDPFTLYAIADEYRRAGDLDRSRSYFERLVEEHPDYVGTYYHLAALYLETGHKERALATYRSGISVAENQRDTQARSELQAALLEADGVSFD